jgi:nitric oxide reductase subunit B
MPWMLFYAALAIPVFYAVGLCLRVLMKDLASMISGASGLCIFGWKTFSSCLRTVVVAYMFVLLGVVREATALRVIYLHVVLYSRGGVIGTMHHLYFSGTPVAHLVLGATFSALEVIPLLLLTL